MSTAVFDAFWLTLLGLWTWLSIVVAKDASRRAMKGRAWWALVFFGGIPGLLLYYVIRGPRTQEEKSDE